MDWNDLKHFLAVARSGSLTEAAVRLCVSPATVARRILALEEALGMSLFQRRTDGYALTERGRSLLDAAEQAESQMLWIARGGGGETEDGVVRLAMPELLGNHFIVPALSGFLEAHPGIGLDMVADVRSARLTRGEADMLVRLARPEQGGYHVKRLGRVTLDLFAAPGYVARHGMLAGPAGHRFIGWGAEMAYLPLARWLSRQSGGAVPAVQAHTMGSQLAAARAGMGIAVLPAFVGQEEGLVRMRDDGMTSDVWLLLRDDSRLLRRVRLVAGHLEQAFAAAADRLSGP